MIKWLLLELANLLRQVATYIYALLRMLSLRLFPLSHLILKAINFQFHAKISESEIAIFNTAVTLKEHVTVRNQMHKGICYS